MKKFSLFDFLMTVIAILFFMVLITEANAYQSVRCYEDQNGYLYCEVYESSTNTWLDYTCYPYEDGSLECY